MKLKRKKKKNMSPVEKEPKWSVLETKKEDIHEDTLESNLERVDSKKILRQIIKDDSADFDDKMFLSDRLRLIALTKEKESGKKEKEELLKERKHNEEYQAYFSTLKKFLLEELETNLDSNRCTSVEIQIDDKFSHVVYPVLNSYEFNTYDYEEKIRNTNLVTLGVNVPRVFIFSIAKE